MADTRTFITGLVAQINTATDPESVTNQMVARVMQYFLDDLASLLQQIEDLGGDLDTEEEARRSLADHIGDVQSGLQAQIDALTSGNTSQAIDNFNEIIAFLEGVRQSETLQDLLNNIKLRIDALEGDTSDLSDALDTVEQRITALEGRCRNLEDRYIDLAEYAHQNAELPANGVYLWEGYPVDSRIYSRSDGDTYWLVFCIKKGDTSESRFGIGVSDCLVFSAESRTDTFTFVARYEGNTVPDHVQKAFGYTLASATNDGLMSKEDKDKLDNLTDELMEKFGRKEVAVAWFWGEWPKRRIVPLPEKAGMYMYFTDTHSLSVSEETTPGNFEYVSATLDENVIYIDGIKNIPYIWNGTDMVPIAPENVPASIFNATTEIPVQGYYSLLDPDNQELSAVHAAWNAGKSVSGLILSFELSAGIWKTYQYIGKTVTQTNWLNAENWKDFGSLAAGSEPYIIIDSLIGRPSVGEYYTLETAVQQLLAYQQSSGVTYAKIGLIITYSTGENTMESKQFQGTTVNDFGEVGLWKDFGGGGSSVETKDTPEEGGTDALSTGGAYKAIPTGINLNTDTPGVVKMQLVNAKGEGVGDEQQFPVGTGTGGSATILSIVCEKSPLYVSAGGTVELKAAIKSATTQGNTETLNDIETVEIWDRDTNQVLETLNVNRASSADLDTFDFIFNLSSYFTTAGTMRLKLVAYDNAGNSGQRTINVIAVDVTVTSAQTTLNYTSATALAVGGAQKSLPMYKFANNASDKGIFVTTEIFIGGQWRTLGTATVMDTYSHSVTINPADCLGYTMEHGAYPIRVHGEDIGSRRNDIVGTGVQGNYLHTAVMVIEEGNTTPVIVSRWYSEQATARVKLYETISVDFAVYDQATTAPTAAILVNDVQQTERTAYRSQTYTYLYKVQNVETDGSVTLNVRVASGTASSQAAPFVVFGSMLSIEEVRTQLQFDMDFSTRSNSEADHTISDSGVTLQVQGVNWDTTGFVKDSFGTDKYGTEQDPGVMALRIAEDATGVLSYKPFDDDSIEQNGLAIQFAIRKKNIADDSARLISCIANGFGFYVDGKNVVFTTDNAETVAKTITAAVQNDETTHVAIVIEPVAVAPYGGIGVVKMYFDGEEIGACEYTAGSLTRHDTPVTFYGIEGDLYLYSFKAWKTYYSFEQAFDNYLLKMYDTDQMVTEYQFNDVMASVTAENTTKNRPQAAALYNMGMPYFVVCKHPDTADNEAKDNYPEYLETLDGDKKTKRLLVWFAYFPDRPWQDCKLVMQTTNQGTTSAKRPIKNIKGKIQSVELLHQASEFSGSDLEKYNECLANAQAGRIQVKGDSLPTKIVTVKVDYSESGGANNGGSTHLFNDLQRALGDRYVTPAQKVYNKAGHPYIINTSIASTPIAFFRTDRYSPDATSPSYGYFHAKGNWNEDKGDAKVFGFEDVDGYNKGCLNYGDFIELVANRDETLADFASRVDKSQWVADNIYVLSEFCGPLHKVFRYREGAWTETTGNMTYTGGRWVITGDVVNPVENYELRKYDGFCWFQGVNSVDDLLQLDAEDKPVWLQYYESRYPDNDDLNDLYEQGKKIPYQLYRWLRFCQECNQNLNEDNGRITINGSSVNGTTARRLEKWQKELHNYANVYSVLCYHVFTDYIAAVDQRAKNMMVGFYLDEDGVVRMYLNHLYDGDTILGSDNDCGLTIPATLDPNNDPGGVYQGHDSVLFTQNAALGNNGIWLDDEGDNTVTVRLVAQAMREVTLSDGLHPFSYAGLIRYFVTLRLNMWPKVVSSFDGERKYIEHSKATANYFYALHGLSIQRLKDFIKTRFLFRDGFYQTGDMFASKVTMRATGTNITIRIKAAKAGYFGIGVDRTNVATDSCYLEAGQSYTLRTYVTNTGSGTALYVFGANNLAELDLSNCTPSPFSWDISELVLIRKLFIGGASYVKSNNNEGYLSTLNLGNLPFLEELDIRKTDVTTVNARYCPRLTTVKAAGSKLQRIDVAPASKITYLQIPETYKTLSLRHLPALTMEGIVFERPAATAIERVIVESCAHIDGLELLAQIINQNSAGLKYVRVTPINAKGRGDILEALSNISGLQGVDATLADGGAPALVGTYRLTKYTEDEYINKWAARFPELTIKQQAYSAFKENDLVTDSENVTNLDNQTGYDYGTTFEPSGHILKIRRKCLPVAGTFDKNQNGMHLDLLSKQNYKKYYDGSDFDNTDQLGRGTDSFIRIPRHWYKGINDFKNQEKYTLVSYNTEAPEDTWTVKKSATLAEAVYRENVGLAMDNVTVGEAFNIDTAVNTLSSCSVYRIDVEDMKQVRYVGMNNATYGAAFVDANGQVISKAALSIAGTTDSPVDFSNEQGDYVFRDVPAGAKYLYFTAMRVVPQDIEVFAVDSDDIEAIEPGWELFRSGLEAIYAATIDDLGLLRSIAGRTAKRGNGTSVTSTEWVYDADGTPTAMPVSAMNYTYQDFLNLCAFRGEGYMGTPYEASKQIALISRFMSGNRDDQRVYGFGNSPEYQTGVRDNIGAGSTVYGVHTGVTKVLGMEGFVGCIWEIMDCVGVNISDFKSWRKNKRPAEGAANGKWHIYNPFTQTERVVQGLTSGGGQNIARLKHGRHCDCIPASVSTDTSQYSKSFAAGWWISNSGGRCVGRSSSYAHAYGGLVYAYASSASSSSSANDAVRLAFFGRLLNESEIDALDDATNEQLPETGL